MKPGNPASFVVEAILNTVAVYSMKGGVGKTTLAVNLAWASAASGLRTLLWDLDAQGGATFILTGQAGTGNARQVLERDLRPADLIVATGCPALDLLPADTSLRALDTVFTTIDRKKRLRRLLEIVGKKYDRVFLDCPPGLGPTSEQVIRASSLIVMPTIPSALSRRSFDEVRDFLAAQPGDGPVLLPVFNMVDRRRSAHRRVLGEEPGVVAIPMASAVEQMADRRAAVFRYAARSAAATALAQLSAAVESRLAAASLPPGKTIEPRIPRRRSGRPGTSARD